jgi:hypothetical protein
MLGELRAMAIAIPGARGIFSHLQAALQTRHVTHGRIRVSRHVRATLDDFAWLTEHQGAILRQAVLFSTVATRF